MNENTIIKPEDIKKVRPIANNIIEVKRIEPYIHEAETLDVMPSIGIGLYEQFTSDGFIEAMRNDDSAMIITNSGKEIVMTAEQWREILDGCYYTCKEGSCDSDSKRYSGGLRAAISYLSYSRMLPNQPINVTAFGVVNKTTALSDPVDEKTLFRATNEAKKIGLEYLRQSVDLLRCKGFIDDCKKNGTGKRFKKFRAIGYGRNRTQ
jgi:hypothetical protein